MADLERGDLHLPKSAFFSLSLFSCASYPSASKSPSSPLLSYISCIRREVFFLLDIHDTRYPVLLSLHPIWEIYVYYVRTLTLLELAVLLFSFIMGYHYGLWRLRFGLLLFSSLQCNCSFSFPVCLFVCLQKWLRWGVFLVHIGMVGWFG